MQFTKNSYEIYIIGLATRVFQGVLLVNHGYKAIEYDKNPDVANELNESSFVLQEHNCGVVIINS